VSEQSRKLEIIRSWMTDRDLDGLYLQCAGSFAWATCGAASYINTASTYGQATLLITHDRQYLFTSNIEAPRLQNEEQLIAQGWEFQVSPWHASTNSLANLRHGMTLGSDSPFEGASDVSADLARLRMNLTPEEVQRFKELGRLCADAMQAAIQEVKPGQTEYQLEAYLASETEARGAQAIVTLIATDERIISYRHPLPTAKRLEKYAMLVLCGRKNGLICSITRLVHFGPLPDDLKRKIDACATVDAAVINSTRPGRSLGEIFDVIKKAYSDAGYPEEWRKHHQGGPCGYEPREFLVVPNSTERVAVDQVYAWNPSITGCKSEDTILVGENHNEVLTAISGWPVISINGTDRPAVLVV
jgi:Xaa-Pro aminopeptidase